MTMTSPVTALASRIAFVTTNTASPTSALYTVKPLEAATWPTNSQRETPSLALAPLLAPASRALRPGSRS